MSILTRKPVPESPFTAEWRADEKPVAYPDAVTAMEERVAAIEPNKAPELFWLLEHPPLYTVGTSAAPDELKNATRFPVFETGRGGRATYHGPGQRVIYALCDLRLRERDVHKHVCRLEEWVIKALGDFGVRGERRAGRIGIWVDHQGREEKIAAIGVRVRRWVTYHGLALNVSPDLSHYDGIVPCGLPQFGVTSMHAMGVKATMAEVDAAFRRHAPVLFGV